LNLPFKVTFLSKLISKTAGSLVFAFPLSRVKKIGLSEVLHLESISPYPSVHPHFPSSFKMNYFDVSHYLQIKAPPHSIQPGISQPSHM